MPPPRRWALNWREMVIPHWWRAWFRAKSNSFHCSHAFKRFFLEPQEPYKQDASVLVVMPPTYKFVCLFSSYFFLLLVGRVTIQTEVSRRCAAHRFYGGGVLAAKAASTPPP